MMQQSFKQNQATPLAEALRPHKLYEYIGQSHIVGEGKVINRLIAARKMPSIILWGPPGVGKTTLARIISAELKFEFYQISAVSGNKADLRFVVESAKTSRQFEGDKSIILFIDEIHRFNKAQQDFLLPYVEDGTIILIGATTENPSFEVNSALLSRCKVFVLEQFKAEEAGQLLQRALNYLQDERGVKIKLNKKLREVMINLAAGDPRSLLNGLEMLISAKQNPDATITKAEIEDVWQKSLLLYDKNGEEHYNIISALHKSMRASDPDASVYWLLRMLSAGEDPLYVARRMLRFASEDIGNADFRALLIANAVFDTCHKVGMPECRVALVQLAIYLAKAPKDNSAYVAEKRAMQDIESYKNLPVPMHLRNAPTKLMGEIGYGKGYVYDHDVAGKKSGQQCLPDKLKHKKYV